MASMTANTDAEQVVQTFNKKKKIHLVFTSYLIAASIYQMSFELT